MTNDALIISIVRAALRTTPTRNMARIMRGLSKEKLARIQDAITERLGVELDAFRGSLNSPETRRVVTEIAVASIEAVLENEIVQDVEARNIVCENIIALIER